MSKPITPAEATDGATIPDFVFDTINALLRSGAREIRQFELTQELAAKGGVQRELVFKNGWLEFEGAYRATGWHVEYDKPGFNESYGAYWRFSRGGK